ncbi:MAG TPA: hypothetical protein DDX71_03985 [Ruminococcus sp.]|nr:hypothetical protein [Ruminococcus sp.]
MAFITYTCPQCGGQSQVEAGKDAMCPYCARVIDASAVMPEPQGAAFAQQDVQFAPPPAQAVPPMLQKPAQAYPQAVQPAAMPAPQMQQGQFAMQQPQYSQAQLAQAHKKRRSWKIMNWSMIGIQALTLALGIFMDEVSTSLSVPMILTWLLSQPACGVISAMMRPDDAYLEKKPPSRVAQGFLQALLGLSISAPVGGILFAIIEALFL